MNRFYLLSLSGWVVAAVVVVCGAGVSQDLRCRSLTVEDESGRDRIRLRLERGMPRVELLRPDGKPDITLESYESGSGLNVRSYSPDSRVSIYSAPAGQFIITKSGKYPARSVVGKELPSDPRD